MPRPKPPPMPKAAPRPKAKSQQCSISSKRSPMARARLKIRPSAWWEISKPSSLKRRPARTSSATSLPPSSPRPGWIIKSSPNAPRKSLMNSACSPGAGLPAWIPSPQTCLSARAGFSRASARASSASRCYQNLTKNTTTSTASSQAAKADSGVRRSVRAATHPAELKFLAWTRGPPLLLSSCGSRMPPP